MPLLGWPFQFHRRLASCFPNTGSDAADRILSWAAAVPTALVPHSSPSMKTYPVAEVRTSCQGRGHAHVDQEGLPVSWPVCLLFLLHWGQLFFGGDRYLGTLKTSTHHPFSNFSVLTHAEEGGRDRLFTLRRWTRILSQRRNSGEMSPPHWVGRPAQSGGPWAVSTDQAGFNSRIKSAHSLQVHVLFQEWKLLAQAKDTLRSISHVPGKHGFLSPGILLALCLL